MTTSFRARESVSAPIPEVFSPTVSAKKAQSQLWVKARFDKIVSGCEILADLATIVAAVLCAYFAYHSLQLGKRIQYSPTAVLGVAFAFACVGVWLLERNGAYRRDSSLLRVKETERVLRVSSQVFLAAFSITFFTSYLLSRWMIVFAFLLVPVFLIAEKQFLIRAIRALHIRGYGMRKVVLYGAGPTGRRIFSVLVRSPKLGLDPIAIVDDEPARIGTTIFESSYRPRRSAAVLAGPLTQELLWQYDAEMVVIADPSISRDRFSEIAKEAIAADAAISFVPQHFAPSDYWINYMNLDGLLLASFEGPKSRSSYDYSKRFVDLALSLALLLLTAPLLLFIALIIRITSSGPALFVQQRVGQNGKLFMLYKLRTMHTDAPPYAYSPKTSADPRITPFGQFLRRTSLDELPQLLNVIKGEMSLVGPRPEMPFIVEQYNWLQRQRLQVKPGITGLWQLSADRNFLMHENIEYDLYYIRNRNFSMDLAILLHTFVFAARGV